MSACAVATEPAINGELTSAGGSSAGQTNPSSAGAGASAGGGAIPQGGSPGSAGATNTGSAGHTVGGTHAGGAASGGAASSGGTSSSAGGVGGSNGGSPSGGSPSGGSPSGGSINGTGGSSGTAHGFGDPWTFDSSLQGWAVRDHSANITTMPTATSGVVSFAGLPFSMASEYSDFAFSFSSDANLAGLKVHARIRRVSGGFIGAQVYAYGGAWLGSTFTSLNSADFMDVILTVPTSASAGFDPTQVSRIGIKLNTGSNASNSFSATTIEIDSVTLE